MRILVTGGAGFIGSHLVEALVRRGDEVTVLDDLSGGKLENLADVASRIRWIRGDVRDAIDCGRAVQGAEVVFHLAALPSVARSVEDPVTSVSVNELGTATLLAACRAANVRRLVYSSSSSVYGDDPTLPKSEALVPQPLSPYASGKLAGEYACRAFAASGGPPTVCLRYFNVYGPRQDPRSAYAAVIPSFCERLLSGNAPVIYGDGAQTRDFTYVADVVHANLAAAAAPLTRGEAVNVACGARTSLLDLLRILEGLSGARIPPQHKPFRPGDVRDSWADVSLARASLGFSPRTSLEDGLRRTLEFYRKNRQEVGDRR